MTSLHLVVGLGLRWSCLMALAKTSALPFPSFFVWDKIMLRKRYIIECINHLLKDKGNLVHSRHRSINNFLMNLIAAITAYCFFDNKPEAIKGYCVEDNKQLTLF